MGKDKNYTVYIHICPNNKVYVGITFREPEKRWKKGNGYKENKHFSRAIKKYGWENIKHEILFVNLSKEEAEVKEIELIKEYKANNGKYGYNIENGGFHNGKTSEITKQKQSILRKGKHNSPNTEFKKGRKGYCSEKHKLALSKMRKGKHMSIKTEFKKGHMPANAKKVMCIETGEVFITVKEAGIKTNSNIGHISTCCKGKRQTCNKLHWKYVN